MQSTLDSFGVRVKMGDISLGPSVTRYELIPEQGVKVSRITGLNDDIKLSLAASDIRIEAPIPGKAAVGIEVPNPAREMITLRELLESSEFTKAKSKVTFAVGKDISGKTIVTDIAKMPHLLIAGATGSGKSVLINTLIMSIIYKADPNEVKMIMVDPKMTKSKDVKKVEVTNVQDKNITLGKGKKLKLSVNVILKKGSKASKAVKFESSKKSVVTVSKKGVLKAKKIGKAKITVKSKANPAKQVKFTVTVAKKNVLIKKISMKKKLTTNAQLATIPGINPYIAHI